MNGSLVRNHWRSGSPIHNKSKNRQPVNDATFTVNPVTLHQQDKMTFEQLKPFVCPTTISSICSSLLLCYFYWAAFCLSKANHWRCDYLCRACKQKTTGISTKPRPSMKTL